MERVFTHAEASQLLPQLTELLSALRTAHRRSRTSTAEIEHHPVSSNGSAAAAIKASGRSTKPSASR